MCNDFTRTIAYFWVWVYNKDNMIKKCLYCSNNFKTFPCKIKAGKGKFCSKNCWHLFHTKECICGHCGKQYRNPITQMGDKYCSKHCYINSIEFFNKIELAKIKYSKTIIKNCLQCEKELKTVPSRIKLNRGKYCSQKCRNLGYTIPKEILRKNKNECNKRYRKKNNDWYIAIKHKRRALQSLLGGSFTKDEWRELKEKNTHTCLICKKQEPEIKLTVDHIIPLVKWKKWSKENKPKHKWNDIKNIQPLCGRCNSKKWATISNKDKV